VDFFPEDFSAVAGVVCQRLNFLVVNLLIAVSNPGALSLNFVLNFAFILCVGLLD
jgi:hypothetical protein